MSGCYSSNEDKSVSPLVEQIQKLNERMFELEEFRNQVSDWILDKQNAIQELQKYPSLINSLNKERNDWVKPFRKQESLLEDFIRSANGRIEELQKYILAIEKMQIVMRSENIK